MDACKKGQNITKVSNGLCSNITGEYCYGFFQLGPFILVICHISNRVSNGMEKMYFGGIKGENSIEICVLDVQYSNNGEKCKNKCQKDGASYNWCYTGSGSWDYCTF